MTILDFIMIWAFISVIIGAYGTFRDNSWAYYVDQYNVILALGIFLINTEGWPLGVFFMLTAKCV